MIQPWPREGSEPVADCRIFKVRKDRVISPRTATAHDMFIAEHPDWVNVIPLTADGKVVLVRQWRHGSRQIELETPGGLIDPDESPTTCAARELREETGYRAKNFRVIGKVRPNPAFQDNTLHYVLAEEAFAEGEPTLDHAEDIEVKEVDLALIPAMIRRFEITHSLVVGAFYFLGLDPIGHALKKTKTAI